MVLVPRRQMKKAGLAAVMAEVETLLTPSGVLIPEPPRPSPQEEKVRP